MSANTVEPNEKEELAAASPPATSSRRLAEKEEDDDDLAIDFSKSDEDDGGHASDDEQQRKKRLDLKTVRSYASDTSAATGLSTPGAGAKEKRPWYRNLNPLRWGAVPPVPTEREVSREYRAGFWSMLTFQWMSPLMSVSDQ